MDIDFEDLDTESREELESELYNKIHYLAYSDDEESKTKSDGLQNSILECSYSGQRRIDKRKTFMSSFNPVKRICNKVLNRTDSNREVIRNKGFRWQDRNEPIQICHQNRSTKYGDDHLRSVDCHRPFRHSHSHMSAACQSGSNEVIVLDSDEDNFNKIDAQSDESVKTIKRLKVDANGKLRLCGAVVVDDNDDCDYPPVVTKVVPAQIKKSQLKNVARDTHRKQERCYSVGDGDDVVINVMAAQKGKAANGGGKWRVDETGGCNVRMKRCYVRCYRCGTIGHNAAACKSRLACIICGYTDHRFDKCTLLPCFQCSKIGHRDLDCTRNELAELCMLCSVSNGRHEHSCPNNWRKYRMTTSTEDIVESFSDDCHPTSATSCFTCGKQGHYGLECEQFTNKTIIKNSKTTSQLHASFEKICRFGFDVYRRNIKFSQNSFCGAEWILKLFENYGHPLVFRKNNSSKRVKKKMFYDRIKRTGKYGRRKSKEYCSHNIERNPEIIDNGTSNGKQVVKSKHPKKYDLANNFSIETSKRNSINFRKAEKIEKKWNKHQN